MPKTSEMRESKFLKQSDIGTGALMTIESCDKHNVAKEGAEPEHKWCLSFEESDKPLVLNRTNIQLCERIFGSDDTDEWIGKKIVLYVDPNVSYAGELVGGIRVRAPKVKTNGAAPAVEKPKSTPKVAAPPPPAIANELPDDDIPF
jgi:hypothetical protein